MLRFCHSLIDKTDNMGMAVEFENLLKHTNQSYLNLYLRTLSSGLSIYVLNLFLFYMLPRMHGYILLDFDIYVCKSSDSYFFLQNPFSFSSVRLLVKGQVTKLS